MYQNQPGELARINKDGTDRLINILLQAIKELRRNQKPLFIMDIQRYISRYFEENQKYPSGHSSNICPECKTTLSKRLDLTHDLTDATTTVRDA